MATLNQIESDLFNDLNEPTKINLQRITIYLEIILLIIQFAKDKGIWKDGRVSIKWTHWLSIISLFRLILEKLRAS
jgi:hypothetical protein